ncbi:MAG TPA: tripartite tricarboxylate transporter substrate binding protein [Burkholderiales bacterium]|nr:tripartite tricarboxylate transporter substrate binding protein [Burkholderiales bacterium]
MRRDDAHCGHCVCSLLRSFAVIVAGCLAWAVPSPAQQYPARPVRLIVPFAPGGTVDVLARVLGARLAELTGHPVVVDNRGGAGGVIGTELATQARGDGHTLLLHSAALAYEPALRAKLPYDTLRDLAPVTLVGTTPNLLVVHPAFPARSAAQLIAMAKAKPGAITFGTGGIGSASHLAVELFRTMSGTSFNHVPYKGAGPALADVVAGQLDFMIATMPGALPHVQAGRLRALGISSQRRSPAAPEIPTIAETGLPGYEFSAWFGMLAPAATPPKLLERIGALLREALHDAATRAKMSSLGVEPQAGTAAEFSAHLRAEIARWARIIREAGIKPQ